MQTHPKNLISSSWNNSFQNCYQGTLGEMQVAIRALLSFPINVLLWALHYVQWYGDGHFTLTKKERLLLRPFVLHDDDGKHFHVSESNGANFVICYIIENQLSVVTRLR